MESIKIKALSAIEGWRFSFSLLFLLSFFIYLSSGVCFSAGLAVIFFGAEDMFPTLSARLPLSGITVTAISGVLFLAEALFLVICGASLTFYTKSRIYAGTGEKGDTCRSLIGVGAGCRYLGAKVRAHIKINGKGVLLLLPFFFNSGLFLFMLNSDGMTMNGIVAGILLSLVSLSAGLFALLLTRRRYEPLAFILWQNPLLKPGAAVKIAEKYGNNRLGAFTLAYFCHLPLRLSCLFLLPYLWFLPYTEACRGVICREITTLPEA